MQTHTDKAKGFMIIFFICYYLLFFFGSVSHFINTSNGFLHSRWNFVSVRWTQSERYFGDFFRLQETFFVGSTKTAAEQLRFIREKEGSKRNWRVFFYLIFFVFLAIWMWMLWATRKKNNRKVWINCKT